jgi:murein L,D-transpeptidase YafK
MKIGVNTLKMEKRMKIQWIAVVGILVLMMAGCEKKSVGFGKLDKTPYDTKECINELSKGKELDPKHKIDKLVVYKKKRTLYAYRNGKVVEEFRISLGKNGDKGNKIQEGDYRTPIGSYSIVRKKCDSRLYRSLMISYPSEADKARSRAKGVSPGGYITIHGQPKWNADGRGDEYTLSCDWTEGCVAVPNRAMDKLWRAVENGVPIEIHA